MVGGIGVFSKFENKLTELSFPTSHLLQIKKLPCRNGRHLLCQYPVCWQIVGQASYPALHGQISLVSNFFHFELDVYHFASPLGSSLGPLFFDSLYSLYSILWLGFLLNSFYSILSVPFSFRTSLLDSFDPLYSTPSIRFSARFFIRFSLYSIFFVFPIFRSIRQCVRCLNGETLHWRTVE